MHKKTMCNVVFNIIYNKKYTYKHQISKKQSFKHQISKDQTSNIKKRKIEKVKKNTKKQKDEKITSSKSPISEKKGTLKKKYKLTSKMKP